MGAPCPPGPPSRTLQSSPPQSLTSHPSSQCSPPLGTACHVRPLQCCLHGVCVCVSRSNCVRLFATSWTVACQAPLSMGFSRPEYWSGWPFPSPGDLPNPGIKPRFPALQADSLLSELPGTPIYMVGEFSSTWGCLGVFPGLEGGQGLVAGICQHQALKDSPLPILSAVESSCRCEDCLRPGGWTGRPGLQAALVRTLETFKTKQTAFTPGLS